MVRDGPGIGAARLEAPMFGPLKCAALAEHVEHLLGPLVLCQRLGGRWAAQGGPDARGIEEAAKVVTIADQEVHEPKPSRRPGLLGRLSNARARRR